MVKNSAARCRVFRQPSTRSWIALPKVLDVVFHVEGDTIWEDEWRLKITIACNHPKHHEEDWMLSFYQYEYESVLILSKHSEIFVFQHQVEQRAVLKFQEV